MSAPALQSTRSARSTSATTTSPPRATTASGGSTSARGRETGPGQAGQGPGRACRDAVRAVAGRRAWLLLAQPARGRVIRSATCSDISPGSFATLAVQRRAPRARRRVASTATRRRLPVADESFDLVLGHAGPAPHPRPRRGDGRVLPRSAPGRARLLRGRAVALRRPPRGAAQARGPRGTAARRGCAPVALVQRRRTGAATAAASPTTTAARVAGVDVHAFAPAELTVPRAVRASVMCACAARGSHRERTLLLAGVAGRVAGADGDGVRAVARAPATRNSRTRRCRACS